MKNAIGISLMTFVVMIGLGGGVVDHNANYIAFYGLVFALGTFLITYEN